MSVCYSARLENVSGVYGTTWGRKRSELSTERLYNHVAHDPTLAAPWSLLNLGEVFPQAAAAAASRGW